MSDSNWIEQKVQREQTLKDKASDVWQDARSALQDCCASFRKHYEDDLGDRPENGLRIRITRFFEVKQEFHPPSRMKKHLLAAFTASGPYIEITVDEGTPRKFKIDADQAHAFIADSNGAEISLGEFSQKALERFLFADPTACPKAVGLKFPSTQL